VFITILQNMNKFEKKKLYGSCTSSHMNTYLRRMWSLVELPGPGLAFDADGFAAGAMVCGVAKRQVSFPTSSLLYPVNGI
jgi:hypothetical protein